MARLRSTSPHRHRIAIVDDDADLLASTQGLLAGDGHEIRTAADAAAGVALVRDWQPDLLLLDYYLGQGTGADVVRAVRGFDRLVQILLVTGYASEQPARRLLAELDIQGYHDKSDGAARLLVQVDAALKHRRALVAMDRQRLLLRQVLDAGPAITRLQPAGDLLHTALLALARLVAGGDGLMAASNSGLFVLRDAAERVSVHAGTGRFEGVHGLNALPEDVAAVVERGLEVDAPEAVDGRYVVFPLCTREGARGCMVVAAPALPDEARDPAELFTRQVLAALENTLLFERATVDPLTQLSNRGFGLQRFTETLRLAARIGTPTSLLMLDIDHFKAINDRWGHPGGDLTLRAVAQRVAQCCRSTDITARYGGEELIVVLPATDLAGAVVLADRIRRAVETHAQPYEDGEIRCTLSAGVAQAAAGEDVGAVIRRADAALYRAKREGRNCCRVAQP